MSSFSESKRTLSSSLPLDAQSTLTIAFVILQLLGVIEWSWWWVISPMLFEAILTLLILVITIVDRLYADSYTRSIIPVITFCLSMALPLLPAITLILLVVFLT